MVILLSAILVERITYPPMDSMRSGRRWRRRRGEEEGGGGGEEVEEGEDIVTQDKGGSQYTLVTPVETGANTLRCSSRGTIE